MEDASERLYNIYQLRSGQLLSEARIQTTFNTLYDLKLQAQNNIDSLPNLLNEAKEFITKIDSIVGIEPTGELFKNLTKEEQLNLQKEISSELDTLYQTKALEKIIELKLRNLLILQEYLNHYKEKN